VRIVTRISKTKIWHRWSTRWIIDSGLNLNDLASERLILLKKLLNFSTSTCETLDALEISSDDEIDIYGGSAAQTDTISEESSSQEWEIESNNSL